MAAWVRRDVCAGNARRVRTPVRTSRLMRFSFPIRGVHTQQASVPLPADFRKTR
jgi:hypothetical protein